jgi:hypothetical protein
MLSSSRTSPVRTGSPCVRPEAAGDPRGVVAAVRYDPHHAFGPHEWSGGTVHLRIEPQRGSVPAARHWATAQAHDAGVPAPLIQIVELLISELVANAVVHAASPDITLHVVTDGHRFTAAVTDSSNDLPVTRTTGADTPGGQGIRLIELLATTWGTDTHPSGGKTIWFTVDRDQPPHPGQ